MLSGLWHFHTEQASVRVSLHLISLFPTTVDKLCSCVSSQRPFIKTDCTSNIATPNLQQQYHNTIATPNIIATYDGISIDSRAASLEMTAQTEVRVPQQNERHCGSGTSPAWTDWCTLGLDVLGLHRQSTSNFSRRATSSASTKIGLSRWAKRAGIPPSRLFWILPAGQTKWSLRPRSLRKEPRTKLE